MNGTSIFSLYFSSERESDEGQVIVAYLKKRVFSMPSTFLAREIVLLTEEDSPDTSDGGTSTKQQTVTYVHPQKQAWLKVTCRLYHYRTLYQMTTIHGLVNMQL